MKTKLLFIAAFTLALSINAFAQIDIKPEKITYQRTKKDVPDYKKTFDITYPKFSGINDPVVKKNLEDTLSYWKIFEMNLEEELSEFYGLDSAEYEVNYNKNSILDIRLMMDVSGAYPSTVSKNLVVDLKTGKRIHITDVFTNIGQLIAKIGKAKKENEIKALIELKKDNPEDAAELKQMLIENNYSVNELEEFSDQRRRRYVLL